MPSSHELCGQNNQTYGNLKVVNNIGHTNAVILQKKLYLAYNVFLLLKSV